jgi:hypothetical protein
MCIPSSDTVGENLVRGFWMSYAPSGITEDAILINDTVNEFFASTQSLFTNLIQIEPRDLTMRVHFDECERCRYLIGRYSYLELEHRHLSNIWTSRNPPHNIRGSQLERHRRTMRVFYSRMAPLFQPQYP